MGSAFHVWGLLDRLGFPATPRGGPERAHLLAEAWRRAFADRTLLGDPASAQAALPDLLDPAWLEALAGGLARDRATPSARVRGGDRVRGPPESAETTHLSVADGEGNLVALTTTLNGR